MKQSKAEWEQLYEMCKTAKKLNQRLYLIACELENDPDWAINFQPSRNRNIILASSVIDDLEAACLCKSVSSK